MLNEWVNLIVRWVHVIAGIMWVGQTYFFTWLDGRVQEGLAAGEAKPQVSMIHSGGFYKIISDKSPAELPKGLHWFRWEAAVTWLSGVTLLVVVYYAGNLMIDDSVYPLTRAQAIHGSLALLVVGWFAYDFFWRSPLAKNELVGGLLSYLAVVGIAYGLAHLYSGRAAYLLVGALFGTLMAANVWIRIIPFQRRMVAAVASGKPLDPELGAVAKRRSKHNTYMSVPLVLIMLSNHFPTATYGNEQGWLILSGLIAAGFIARRFMF